MRRDEKNAGKVNAGAATGMVTADEAGKITDESIATYMDSINKGIRAEASLGKRRYSYLVDADDDITERIVTRLKKLGYTVEESREFGLDLEWRTELEISWGKKKAKTKKAPRKPRKPT